jgi:pimeloyl-ACP methyl ester carboxylesterase
MKRLLKILAVLAVIIGAAFLIFRTPDTDAEEMRAKYGAAPSQFVEIGDGTVVHLRDEGPRDAPAIILLHGSNADLHTWEPWVEALMQDYRVIRFDQVGHGLTGPDPAGDYSKDNYASDIDEVADALGLEQFILGGNSMGGSHTIAYALRKPERLKAMILVDAGGLKTDEEPDGNIGFTIAQMPVINQLMNHITPRSLVEQSLQQSVTNQAIVTDKAVDRYWELLRYPGNRQATIDRFGLGWTVFDREKISQISVPTYIIWGTEDALIPVEAGRAYDEFLPNSTLVEYEGIGHLPHEEAADKSASDLKNWLVNQPFSAETP